MYKDNLILKTAEQEIPKELAVRLAGFINMGISEKQLIHVVKEAASLGNPGTEAFAQSILNAADQFALQAQETEADWLQASFWYFLARFPYYYNPTMKQAYIKHKEAYLKATSLSQYPVEIFKIPFAGQEFDTYLRIPANNNASLPLVLIWGGIDIWKSDLQIHQLGNLLLEKGFAVLAIDSPGTGDCPVPISPDAEKWFCAILDAIKERTDINFKKIACYGLSFGGYWATKLAIQLPWLAGAVNVGGPVHDTFKSNWLKQIPDFTYKTLAYACGLNEYDAAFLNYAEALSLVQQKYLPTKENAPLLLINGAQDNLVKIAEIEFLQSQGVQSDSLIFSQDRHVASRNWQLHSQFAVDWLARKLQ